MCHRYVILFIAEFVIMDFKDQRIRAGIPITGSALRGNIKNMPNILQNDKLVEIFKIFSKMCILSWALGTAEGPSENRTGVRAIMVWEFRGGEK